MLIEIKSDISAAFLRLINISVKTEKFDFEILLVFLLSKLKAFSIFFLIFTLRDTKRVLANTKLG